MPVVLVVVLALTAPSPPPSPAPTPLKVIVRTRSSPFCTVLRENIGRSIQGLLVNDRVIAQTPPLYSKMAHDFVSDPRGASMELDEVHLWGIVTALAQNLAKIDTLLADPRLSAADGSQDGAALAQMKSELSAVADQQHRALNLISGVSGTSDLNDILTHPVGLGGTLGKPIDDTQGSTQTNGGFFLPTKLGSQSTVVTDPAVQLPAGDLANNPYARFLEAVLEQQRGIGRLEDAAAQTVLADAPACR